MTDGERFMLGCLRTVLYRVGYRLASARSDVMNATRNADRLVLKNNLDSLHLEINNACEILRNVMVTSDDATDEIDPRDRCNFD
jgi:hypothetical protein